MINVMLQYYLHIEDPDKLPDDVWARKFQILKRIREMERDKSMQDLNKMFSGNG